MIPSEHAQKVHSRSLYNQVQNSLLAALEAVIASKRMREQLRKIFLKNTKPTTKQRPQHYEKLVRGGAEAGGAPPPRHPSLPFPVISGSALAQHRK